jgi:uncharacterized membrane protein
MPENEFWRTEIWHALSVHFPIALLLTSTLTLLISFFLKAERKEHWQNTASGLLFTGCLAAWIAVYTGNMADGIVARKICDPTILKDHEIAGQTMTYLFTSAALVNMLLFFNILKPGIRRISIIIILGLMLIGSGYLIYTGHLGASLVYEQGAGVKNHSVDCNE